MQTSSSKQVGTDPCGIRITRTRYGIIRGMREIDDRMFTTGRRGFLAGAAALAAAPSVRAEASAPAAPQAQDAGAFDVCVVGGSCTGVFAAVRALVLGDPDIERFAGEIPVALDRYELNRCHFGISFPLLFRFPRTPVQGRFAAADAAEVFQCPVTSSQHPATSCH